MSANLSAVPKLQFFDNNGNPLVGGKLFTYEAGTTTPQATYTDASATTPNTNPIILNSRGEADVWLSATTYKFVLTDATDATIWTVDNISNSLSLSQILAASGSAASPPYTFASDTDTGMYLAAVGQLGLTVGGVPVIRSTDTQMVIGQSGGADDVDVTHFGDTAQTGNVTQTGNVIQTGNWTLTGDVNVTGAAVFNEAGADKDFRVEGDTDPNLLFVDASTDRVGIGTNSPVQLLTVESTGNVRATIRNSTETTAYASSLDLATGTGSLSSSNVVARIIGLITQADPSTLQSALTFHTNSGDNIAERMRITAEGNVSISPGGGLANAQLYVQGSSTSGSDYALYLANSDGFGPFVFSVANNGTLNTGLQLGSPYSNTTANAANAHINNNGVLQRSTSSLRYKTDVQDASHGLQELLRLRSVTYAGKNNPEKTFGGFIAEEVHEAGLTEFVEYNKDDQPDALAYGNMVSLCVKAIQEQQAVIKSLVARITALESQ